MAPEQIVEMDWDGRYYGDFVPSSEWRFHYDILKSRPDTNVILHSHAANCATVACCGLDLPPIHYMVAVSGGSVVKCSGYAPFGTKELSVEALKALGSNNACLLGNHGVITLGQTMDQAFSVLAELEHVARIFIGTAALGGAKLLSEKQMAVVLERFKTYGKQHVDPVALGVAPENVVQPPERAGDRLPE